MCPASLDQAQNLSIPNSLPLLKSLPQPAVCRLLQGWPTRVAAILVLFAMQGLWLTVRFDTASLASSSGSLAVFFRFAPLLPRIAITWLVLIPLIRWDRISVHARAFAHAAQAHGHWWIWWLGQWAAFAVLTAASLILFAPDVSAQDMPAGDTVQAAPDAIFTALWIVSAVAASANCLCSLAPPAFWWQFAREERWGLLAGLAASLCVAGSSRLFQMLWHPLGNTTFRLVETWLALVYSESLVSDASLSLLGTQTFLVEIAPQCSGYEGIGLVATFVLVFLAAFRQSLRFPRAWLLLPIGVVTIWICNSLRIAALIVIGTEYSPSVALGGFHSQAGWILFNLVSLGLMAVALRSEFFSRNVTRTVRQTGPVVPYLLPFLALTALSMILAAVVEHPAALYPLPVVVSLVLLWMGRDVLRRLNWTWSTPALLCGIGVYVAWMGLAWIDWQSRDAVAVALPTCDTLGGMTWTLFRVFGAVVTVPIIEELAFRGFFLRRLVRSEFDGVEYRTVPVWAVLVSSVAFGMLHQVWIGGILAGLAYAWLTRRRGNLVDAIQAHAITNGLIAVTVLCTGAAWLW